MKKSLCGLWVCLLVLTAGCAAAQVRAGSDIPPPQIELVIEEESPAKDDLTFEDMVDILVGAYFLIQRDALKAVDAETMMQEAAKAMTALIDRHTVLMDPETARKFYDPEEKIFGIGTQIQETPEKTFVVKKVYHDSPAEKAGIMPGDELIAVDGKALQGFTLTQAVMLIRGQAGTGVTVTLRRGGKEITFGMTRAAVSLPLVESRILSSGIGYVHVDVFMESPRMSVVKELEEALRFMNSAGVSALILDVRGNPGGVVNSVVTAVNFFLEPGLVVTEFYGRDEALQERHLTNSKPLATQPMVVLVDKDSASGAEIFAGALQAHHRATVMGEKTFGKGTVQSSYPHPSGYVLKLTIAEYRMPGGARVPVVPDVNAIDDPKTLQDEALEAAEKLLLSR